MTGCGKSLEKVRTKHHRKLSHDNILGTNSCVRKTITNQLRNPVD